MENGVRWKYYYIFHSKHLPEGIAEPIGLHDDEVVAVQVDAIEPTCEQCETDDAIVLPQVVPLPAEEGIGVVTIDSLMSCSDTWSGIMQRQPQVDVADALGDTIHGDIFAP